MHRVKTIRLRVMSSRTLNREVSLMITAKGLEGSGRQIGDGSSYFGCRAELNDVVVNDFVIP